MDGTTDDDFLPVDGHPADSQADFDILLSSRRTLSPVEVAVEP